MTGVNPLRTHGFGVYRGKRVVWSVRVDEKLLKQAKPLLRAKFGSDCRGIELWLAGLVATQKGSELLGVNPSNTIAIGKLVIERNLRSRRKMVVVEEEEEIRKIIPTQKCYVYDCTSPAVQMLYYKPMEEYFPACENHARQLLKDARWRTTKVSIGGE